MSIAMGIGSSTMADVYSAGLEAAREAVSHLADRKPDLVLVFSSIRFADPRMLAAVRSVTGTAPLIGCSDAGGIITSGPRRRSVTVIGLILKNGSCVTAVERHLSQHPETASKRLAEKLVRQSTEKPAMMFVFPDGLTASGSKVLSGIESVIGRRIPLAGASAGDDLFFQKTFQYFNDEILTDSLPGVLLSGDLNIGIGVQHGWTPVGRPRRVTRAAGHIIHQLDHRPALSIYEDFLGLERAELMQENLASVTLTYPLGMVVRGQMEYLLRDAIRVGRGGSLICTGDVIEGSQVRLMIGGYESALEAAQQAACDAKEQLDGAPLTGALVFCSVARQKMLGSEFQGEIDVIRNALGGRGVHFGGFYSYGEFAPQQFYNESVVVIALG